MDDTAISVGNFRRRTILAGAPLLLIPGRVMAAQGCQPVGRYSGAIVSQWLPDGRRMQLVNAVTYIAKCGKRWAVPAGAVVDGASIPAFLWPFVGAPFTGAYRDAAVIHDYYCAVRVEPSDDVHRMFYEAMLASGVSAFKAGELYYGVKVGGPSWDDLTIANMRLAVGSQHPPSPGTDAQGKTVPHPGRAPSDAASLSEARLTVARNAAAEQQFRQFLASATAGDVDLATLDRKAMIASVTVERQALVAAYSPLKDMTKALDPSVSIPLQATGDVVVEERPPIS